MAIRRRMSTRQGSGLFPYEFGSAQLKVWGVLLLDGVQVALMASMFCCHAADVLC